MQLQEQVSRLQLVSWIDENFSPPVKNFVLGHPSVAEGIISWNERCQKKAAGEKNPTKAHEIWNSKFVKETVFGLRLEVIAGTTPCVNLSLDEEKLYAWVKDTGVIGNFLIQSYGLVIAKNWADTGMGGGSPLESAKFSIFIQQSSSEVIILHTTGLLEGTRNKNVSLGKIHITEKGFELETAQKISVEKKEQEPKAMVEDLGVPEIQFSAADRSEIAELEGLEMVAIDE
jgi:hypothetical protein